MKKTILSRILYGIKSGWNLPVLPEHILKLEKNVYIKIFKIIGAICTLISLSGIYNQFNLLLFYITILISVSYILYKYYLIYHSIVQWIKNLLNGKLVVRN